MRAPKITFTLPDGTTVDTQTQRRFVLLGQATGRLSRPRSRFQPNRR